MVRLKSILWFGLGFVVLVSCSPSPKPVDQSGSISGKNLAQRFCVSCHATGSSDVSKHTNAPPFRELGAMYPVELLAEALAEGIIVGHPDMPVFEMSPEQIDALLSYLEQLQARSEN